ELARIAEAQGRLGALGAELAALPDLATHCERQAELARRAERRRALAEREKQLAEDAREAAARIDGLERAPELLREIETQLEERRAALAAAERRVEEVHGRWIQDKQDVRTRLGSYRDRARELREQISQLREAGPEGVCPTCERPLRDEFANVLAALEDEWNSVVQDGKWMSQREKQLELKPPELVAVERERTAVVDALEKDRERHGRCVRAASELGVLIQERERRAEALDSLRAELAELPADYDESAHRAAEARLAQLRGLEREAAKLEQAVDQHAARRKELDDADAAIAAAAARIAELERSHADVGYDEASHAELERAHEAALDEARRAELRRTEAAGRLDTETAAAAKAGQDVEDDRRRRIQLEGLESTIRHHVELDDAFAELRAELNARVRPELGDLASRFLTEITDGRYTNLEIDDDYNVLVLDEGEEKPVISGGEEDIANLVLRLAISQMIAERAGHPLSILILDEVFGSLDVERRDNVIQLLHRLSDRFEQVILITHVETVRDGLDNVVRVDFDERTGASVVRQEEEPVPGEELVAVG
ncbi:MAG: SbcC/MukB-like Walker B domain-containing protein, partial [Longimicrobiales bacterium]